MNSDFIFLTELWRDNKYLKVAQLINDSNWTPQQTAEFCAYMAQYLGLKELNILYKIL